MAVLSALQRALEGLHDVDTELDVTAYVVDDAQRDALPGARQGLPEQLFVREAEDGIEIALYVDPAVVACLEGDDPHERLHAGNLSSYCVALEGVSHFVLLAYRASLGWPVSALELEIQAEVDKFVHGWLLLTAQGAASDAAARALARRLFDGYVLRDDVPVAEHQRYHVATRAARSFCHRLADRCTADRPRDRHRIHHEVRRYYRTGLAEKLRAA
jgi:hypothetical protein